MNENTDSINFKTEIIYCLEVKIPDQTSSKIKVKDKLLVGLDPRNDLVLVDPKMQPKQFLFRGRNNILTVTYLGNDGDTFLNGLSLEKEKIYILEKADILKIGKIEIKVLTETAISSLFPNEKPSASQKISSIDDLKTLSLSTTGIKDNASSEEFNEIKKLQLNPKKAVIKKITNVATKSKPIIDFSTVKLIPYKFYGFIVDIVLTYALLGFVIPSLGLLSIAQDFFFPISEFVSQYLATKESSIASLKILSAIEFFICFHSLMIFSSLILGNTPGASLIGVHRKGKRSFFGARFKAYLHSLLNIVVLPLIIFDIPLYKGRTLKDLLTFSEKELNNSLLIKIFRRAIIPLFIIASLLSPLYLTPPYTAIISIEKTTFPKFVNVHSTHLSSSSKEMGFSLNSDLSDQFALLPYFEKNKIGLIFYDLKEKKSLRMQEQNRISIKQALFKLRYDNPFASLNIPNDIISNEDLKNKVIKSLDLSMLTLLPGFEEFGPFLANGFLLKEQFLGNFIEKENFLLNSFNGKNPVIKISAMIGREEKVFLFGRNEVIEFILTAPKNSKLRENFNNGILSGLRFDQSNNDGLKKPQILEVFEAFERSKYQTILTYYINEAKKVKDLNNPPWQAFFVKNVLQTKLALMNDKTRIGFNKNIIESFDDIIQTLETTKIIEKTNEVTTEPPIEKIINPDGKK